MKFSTLCGGVQTLSISTGCDPDISSLSYDSRRVSPGGLFFALPGAVVDGHNFIDAACSAGSAALVVEDAAAVPENIPYAVVPDARLALSLMADIFYGKPSLDVPVIGITGTNGKTTTTFLVEAMLEKAGLPAAVLGTISYRFGDHVIPAPHTTPESADLQQTLRDLVDHGAKSVVMEVSSHALEQRRVDGCRYDVGIFTNLTPEHLDYHGTMEGYFASKARLFSELLQPTHDKPVRHGVVNIDDPYGKRIVAASAAPVITFGLSEEAMVRALDVDFSVAGIAARVVTPLGEIRVKSRMLGRFNLYNILGAVAAGVALRLPVEAIEYGVSHHKTVAGRVERVDNDRGITVLVDYAHTGDALDNVLRTVKEIATARIITVFGCGGDRDRTKRPVMGKIAAELSDLAIVTSDNPRTEDPEAIIREIRVGIESLGLQEYALDELTNGFSGKGFTSVVSRREAIRLAVRVARPGDVVVLAGKGHEDYQIIGKVKHHFDDREEAANAMRELEG